MEPEKKAYIHIQGIMPEEMASRIMKIIEERLIQDKQEFHWEFAGIPEHPTFTCECGYATTSNILTDMHIASCGIGIQNNEG